MRWLAFNGNPLEMRGRYPEINVGGHKYVMHQLMAQAQRQGNWIDRTGDLIVKAASNQADIERYVSESLVQFALGQRPINDSTWGQFLAGLSNVRFERYEAAAEMALKESGYLK
jgi:putative aldouronate transport system substrate-binding protein